MLCVLSVIEECHNLFLILEECPAVGLKFITLRNIFAFISSFHKLSTVKLMYKELNCKNII